MNIFEAGAAPTPKGPIRLFGAPPLVVADFVVRPDLSQQIHDLPLSVVTAIYGIGGLGKSQLTAKYFNDHHGDYDFAAWIDMRDEHGRAGYERIAELLELPTSSRLDTVQTVRDYIQGHRGTWLIVFDNCDHPTHLDVLLPQSPNAKVVVTTRYRHWTDYAVTVPVDVFDHDLAVAYLCDRTGLPKDRSAHELAKALGHLPLALSLVGSFCMRQQMSFKEYLASKLRPNVISGLTSAESSRTDRALRALWEDSLQAAIGDDASSRETMELLCALDWASIDRVWFSRRTNPRNLGVLYEYSLIELTEKQISVKHNLIADGILSSIVDREELQNSLTALFTNSLIHPSADTATVQELAEPVRHLENVARKHPHLVTARLMPTLNRAMWQLQEQGANRVDFAEIGHQLARQLNGADHPDTITAGLLLAATCWGAGDYRRAAEIESLALAQCELNLEPLNPITLTARNNLAVSLAKLGRKEEARDLAERAYKERSEALGRTHTQTLDSKLNFANRLADLGDHKGAASLDRETVREREHVFGAEHVDTLMAQSNFAVSLAAIGSLDEAVELDLLVYDACKRLLGPFHPDTLTSLHNAAVHEGLRGNVDYAHAIAKRAFSDRKRTLSRLHPDTVASEKLVAATSSSNSESLATVSQLGRRLEALGLSVVAHRDLN